MLGSLDVGVVAQLTCQVLAAIGHLHGQNLVHRDISPDNLVVTIGPGGEPLVKVIDFGIAKSLDQLSVLTKSGTFIGKISYASPEHFGGADGAAAVEPRSDLYSMALVVYELLTGMPAVIGDDTKTIIKSHLFSPPRPFSESDPEGRISAPLRAALSKALEKAPEDRFQDAEGFARALREAAAEEIEASRQPGGPWEQLSAVIGQAEELPKPRKPGSTQHRLDSLFPPSEVIPREELPVAEDDAEWASERLIEARGFLDRGQPDQALDRVRQVLARNPDHGQALRLRAEIEQAHRELSEKLQTLRTQTLAIGKIRTLLDQDDIVRAEELWQNVEALEASTPPALAELGEEIATRKAEQARQAAAEEQRRKEAEDTRRRRQLEAAALELRELLRKADVALESGALETAEEHLRRLEHEFGHDDDEVRTRWLLLKTAQSKRRTDGASTAAWEQPLPETPAAKRRIPTLVWAAGIVAVAAAVGFGAGILQRRPEVTEPTAEVTGSPGLLRLDALPWVQLLTITDADDAPIDIPPETYTPTAVELLAGTYTVTVSHPQLPSPRELKVILRSGETTVEVVAVEPYSVDRYFEKNW